MPHLLNPAGLLALLALAAPLLLHLWRPPARAVRLGSLRFLEAGAFRRRHLRWRERALLFARLALLTLLALLLAQPRWSARPPAGPQRWILLSPDAAPAEGSLEKLQALQSAGYEVRQLAPGFPFLKNDSPAAGLESAPPPDLWSLLREADARLPAGSALAVFAPGRLAALRGARPSLRRCRVEWAQTPVRDDGAARSWLESARLDREGARLRAMVGTSDAAMTRWSHVEMPAKGGQARGPEPGAEFSIEVTPAPGGGGVSARLSGGAGAWTPARVENPLRVKVFHGPDRAEDARYVAAAGRAAAHAAERTVNVSVNSSTMPAAPDAAADWVFWLDSDPVPETITRAAAGRGGGVISEAGGGAAETAASWIIGPGVDALDADAARLWRRTPRARGDAGAALWTDGFGEPLLTETALGQGRQFRFYSRFQSGWNTLAESTALPAALRSGLFADDAGAPEIDRAHDRRLASPEQCQPAEAGAADPEVFLPPADNGGVDLHGGCWILAALLFGLERAWSLQRRPMPRNAAADPPLATAIRG